MKRFLVAGLLALFSTTVFAGQVEDWMHRLDNPKYASDKLSKKNSVAMRDLTLESTAKNLLKKE